MSIKRILGYIRKADQDFNLIPDGAKIAVGISGGKDSILLLYALSLYQKFNHKNFELMGIHIEMGFENMNFSEVDAFCEKHQIQLKHEPSQIYEILKQNPNHEGNIQCSLCSKFKKAAVINAAKKYGYDTIAFGHHGDDAVETLFLNMIYGGKINTFQPKMAMDETAVYFIRPLIYATEKEISKACHQLQLPLVTSTCPVDKHTQREEMKQLLNALYRKYPMSHQNFISMLSNQKQLALWQKEGNKK